MVARFVSKGSVRLSQFATIFLPGGALDGGACPYELSCLALDPELDVAFGVSAAVG